MTSFVKLFQKFQSFYGRHFVPKLWEVMKSGYSKVGFRRDVISGLTVAIVSIPLSMALAIASGVAPANGLYTAVIAGFLIAVLGGSRYQIGGPTGAFVIVIFNVIAKYGYDGLLVAMIVAGILLIVAGACRLGTYIKYIPYPVVVGFTSGIAVLLFSTQIKDLLGLNIDKLPAEILPKWVSYFQNISDIHWITVLVSVIAFVLIIGLKAKRPNWPAYLVAVVATTCFVAIIPYDVDTIGSQFGDMPRFLPMPSFPNINLDLIFKVMPSALTIAFLAGVESLLSATVADGMSGDNHNSNAELIGEGVANVTCAFFAGIPATGAIARTATNIRAGAFSPLSGALQSVFILVFLVCLSPLAKHIPLAALAVILMVIAYNMFDMSKFYYLLTGQKGDRLTLLVTFLLTVFVDLNAAISVGFILYSVIFLHRISQEVAADHLIEYDQHGEDINEDLHGQGVISIRLSGPLFFGGATKIASFFKTIEGAPKVIILRMGNVPMVDVSGMNVIAEFIQKMEKLQAKIVFSNLQPQPHRVIPGSLKKRGITKDISYAVDFSSALKTARRILNHSDGQGDLPFNKH